MSAPIDTRPFHAARFSRMGKAASRFGFIALLAMGAATVQIASAQIAPGTTGIDATGDAKSEMAACKSGKSPQARTTCMTEVRNANAEKRAGRLGNTADYAANALKRCEVFKEADDQAACKERVTSDANAQGSIAGGGVLRQAETVVTPASE